MATPHPTAEPSLQMLRHPRAEAIDSDAVARHFGRRLWRERRRAELSQEALARRAALHRTEIGLLEHGARLPRLDTFIKLAGGLDCGPQRLLVGIAWAAGSVSRAGQFYVEERG